MSGVERNSGADLESEDPKEFLVVREGERAELPSARPVDAWMQPVQAFARHKLAGAALLMGAALIAVVIANSPWASSWQHWLHVRIGLSIGELHLEKGLLHWINDGLMGIFFFVVGLEIKREIMVGELSSVRQAALPTVAAAGGMLLPALLYYALTFGESAEAGWGVPMATDIAFALGVLALLGSRVPVGLKVLLTALAIVDDIGAVVVIAVFYTDGVALTSLAIGAGLLGLSVLMNRLRVRSTTVYLVIGMGVWLAFLQSGVHATIAALLMAFTIPATTRLDGEEFRINVKGHLAKLHEVGLPRDRSMNTRNQQRVFDSIATTVSQAGAPLCKLEHALAPLATFLVLPLFALANAGVSVSGSDIAVPSSVSLGVILGLLVGKPVGVASFTWIALKLGLVDLPTGVHMRHIWGVGFLAGIGFTMALFIGGLAFSDAALVDQAKLGVLAASIAAGLMGYLWLRYGCRETADSFSPEDTA